MDRRVTGGGNPRAQSSDTAMRESGESEQIGAAGGLLMERRALMPIPESVRSVLSASFLVYKS
jgi:hypothetical protein